MTVEAGAGKAPETPAAGNAPVAPPIQPTGKVEAPVIPSDVMPLVEKLFDERMAKVLPTKQAEWEKAQADQKKQAEMTETEKAVARATAAEAERDTLKAENIRGARVRELLGKGIPSLMAEGLLSRWEGEWNVDKAVEMGNAELGPLRGSGASTVPTFPGAGGAPSTGIDALSDEQIGAMLDSGKLKLADYNQLMDKRRFAAAGRTS